MIRGFEAHRSAKIARMRGALGTMHDREFLAVEDRSDLLAGVGRPTAGGVELQVCGPMAKGLAPFCGALEGEGQVVVRIGV